MNDPVRILPLDKVGDLLSREWLVTNGLGGYAAGTVAGRLTRRYHGLLIAALPSPYGRTVMLSDLHETVELPDGRVRRLSADEDEDRSGVAHLVDFRLELGLPIWRYDVAGSVGIEKRVIMPHSQNTTYVVYRMVSGEGPVRLRLKPYLQFRGYEEAVDAAPLNYRVAAMGTRYEVMAGEERPVLRLHLTGERTRLRLDGGGRLDMFFRSEADRGYAARGVLWSPGDFASDLHCGGEAVLVASAEGWHVALALPPDDAHMFESERRRRLIRLAHPSLREGPAAELVLAADQFIIRPSGRIADAARALSTGDDIRTVVAGYHWFTDWGRDTMISLDGLTLVTGRALEAGWILRTFAHYVRDGLIPNMFPEGRDEGLYHTADASLWFFHAVDRYLRSGGQKEVLRAILPQLKEIVRRQTVGTRFGIRADPEDGLLVQGQESYQLTWMDAKVDDWVVTPRRGKAVEINALWYNALRLLEGWLEQAAEHDEAAEIGARAARVAESFNRRFWCESAGHLYDVVDGEHGDDPTCRPNQILAVSLPNPVLDRERWDAVLETVRSRLLTPYGLRTLAPGHPDYKPKYFGDLRARDAAYHQGTVWPWLVGPFVDAWLRVHPDDRQGARGFLEPLVAHLGDTGLGTIAEIFDGDPPYHPRGCVSQAWSVAEWLRCWVKTAS